MTKVGCTNGIDGIAPAGNTDVSPGAQSSLLARWDASLKASLKASRCKVLLCDLALVFFIGERPKGKELHEDNSLSARASTSLWIMGSFPLLRGTGCKAQLLSYTSLPPRSHLFSTKAHNWSFSLCRHSALSCNSFICLACSSYLLSMS